MRARFVVIVTLAVALSSLGGARAAMPDCADDADGGEWRSYGGGLSNARNQVDEEGISPANVGSIEPLWKFRTSAVQQSGGGFSNTPVVADGCVYVASNTGWVYALNAETGALVWKTVFVGQGQTLLGGVIVGSPVVANGMVFVGVSRPGTPYVAAMNQADGAVLWTTTIEGFSPETKQDNSLINASPVLFDPDADGPLNPMIFQGFAGNEGGSVARGGFAIIDASRECSATSATDCAEPVDGATGGARLAHTYTISDAEYAAGYRGASVWCTAAVDPETRHAFACGGNPASKKLEARYSNALLKIDLDPRRDTFGQIVDAYKGEVDQYYPGLDRQPVCDAFGETLVLVWSLACLQLDLDFGSSPQLFEDSLGRLILGDMQKSGVYHAVYADNMQRAWTTVVGAPCAACNASSPAYDGDKIFTVGTPGGAMVSITRETGRYRWAAPIGGGTHFQPVTTANGVVFTMDNAAMLNMFDAETGLLLGRRPFSQDAEQLVTDAGSAGVSVARGTIFAASNEYVIAYRPAA